MWSAISKSLPWPWEDNSVDGVLFNHSLEHLGQNSRVFLGMMKELYRVCRNGAEIEINVPHPRHDNFITDPTHVRIITPGTLQLFDRELNDEWKKIGAANSPLAHYLDVDFKVVRSTSILGDPYSTQFDKWGALRGDDPGHRSRTEQHLRGIPDRHGCPQVVVRHCRFRNDDQVAQLGAATARRRCANLVAQDDPPYLAASRVISSFVARSTNSGL